MGAPLNRIALANRALAKFGAGAIQTFDQSLSPGPAVNLVYESVILGLFAEYPWNFSKLTQKLNQVASETPDASGLLMSGWRYAYQLPANRLEMPEKYLRDPRSFREPVTLFEVQNDLVYCDEQTLYAVGRFRVDEANWPAYFAIAAEWCLAAELVMPVSGTAGILQTIQARAWGTPQENRKGGFLGMAKQADARNGGNKALPSDPLTLARLA